MSNSEIAITNNGEVELPEEYLEAYKDGIRDYYNGVIPYEFTESQIQEAAQLLFNGFLPKAEPELKTVDTFRWLALITMLKMDLRKAGFDSLSLQTYEDLMRAFKSFKFSRYLRKVRKQGRARARVLKKEEKEIRAEMQMIDQERAKLQSEIKECQQEREKLEHTIAHNNDILAHNNTKIAQNDNTLELLAQADEYIKSNLPPHLREEYEKTLRAARLKAEAELKAKLKAEGKGYLVDEIMKA